MLAFGYGTIQVFTPEGTYARSYGLINSPNGIVIDKEGCSVVSECLGSCVSVIDPQGNKVHTFGKVKFPQGVMLEPKSGSLYVANCCARTVLKYSV